MAGSQDASGIQAGSQQEDPDYNGEDFTRPLRSLEFRPEYRTSSGPTSETDRWIDARGPAPFEGNPLDNINLIADPANNFKIIMKNVIFIGTR